MIETHTLDRLAAIDDKSWARIYKDLVRYADYKLNKAGFEIRTEKDSVDAEYFAGLAIEKIFEGVRAWDYVRYPDITIHLIGVVKSLISSHFKSSTRSIVKAGGNADQTTQRAGDDANDDELLSDDVRTTESPEEVLIGLETWQEIERAFGDKKDEHAIFCEWLDGSPPRVIAESLEIPVSEVNNAVKRGTRIVRTLYKSNHEKH
jgi:DNA-directed RNA polymerase specialized sigma24 family protein